MTQIVHLGPQNLAEMDGLLHLFGEVFGDEPNYTARKPGAGYLQSLLASESFIALAAMQGEHIVGGLAAYELRKFEQERSELYIYDLAVRAECRRTGIATGLIEALQRIAAARGAYVILVQSDMQAEDAAAIALYSKLGVREEVLHFDIAVPPAA